MHWSINQKGEEMWDNRGKDGRTNFTFRVRNRHYAWPFTATAAAAADDDDIQVLEKKPQQYPELSPPQHNDTIQSTTIHTVKQGINYLINSNKNFESNYLLILKRISLDVTASTSFFSVHTSYIYN